MTLKFTIVILIEFEINFVKIIDVFINHSLDIAKTIFKNDECYLVNEVGKWTF